MAIYDIFEHVGTCVKQERKSTTAPSHFDPSPSHSALEEGTSIEGSEGKSRFFSSFAARLCFLMLLVADILWSVYATALCATAFVLNCVTCFSLSAMRRFQKRRYLNFKRSFVCGISLLVALFSPALGTMFACTYFLMYDKKGVEEVVPSVFREQFREFFTQ